MIKQVAVKDGRTLANLLRLIVERYFDGKKAQ